MQKSLRYFTLLQLFLLLIGLQFCTQNANQQEAPTQTKDNFEVNKEVTIDDEIMLQGLTDRAGFQLSTYKHWFDSTYQAHPLDSALLAEVKPEAKDINFDIYLGTWCSDSRREVPALYRIMDYLSIEQNQVHQVSVDRSKEVPTELMTIDTLEYVPTIIVYKKGKEVGRIVEFPNYTLEKDIVEMMQK